MGGWFKPVGAAVQHMWAGGREGQGLPTNGVHRRMEKRGQRAYVPGNMVPSIADEATRVTVAWKAGNDFGPRLTGRFWHAPEAEKQPCKDMF